MQERKHKPSFGEEVANVLTHGAGMLFGAVALVVLVVTSLNRGGDAWMVGSVVVYALCMSSSYVTSTIVPSTFI